MSRLVLFRAVASPPARAVMMLGDLLGVPFEYREVKLLQLEHKSEEYKKNINPMGTVPVLQDGDFMLSESHAILKYLTERYGGESRERLYPSEAKRRAVVDQAMFFNAGFFFPRMGGVAIPMLIHGKKPTSSKQFEAIEEAYGVVDAYLQKRRFIATDQFTLADIAVGATATTSQLFLELDRTRYPRFAEWMAELEEMPCFKTVNAEGIAYMRKFVARAKEANNLKS